MAPRPMLRRVKSGYLAAAGLLGLALAFYFAGPASELTLLNRLHYNTLFLLTPCLGDRTIYDDGAVSFSYTTPPGTLNRQEPAFLGIFSTAGKDLASWEDLNLRLSPSYRFKVSAGKSLAGIVEASSPRAVKVGNGEAFISTEGTFGGNGDLKFLYALGKNGYVYRLALPRYPARGLDDAWLLQALDAPRAQGFLYWFLTPAAEKQAYCSAELMIKTFLLK